MSFLNRVRGRLPGHQADVDPHQWRLSSSYPAPKSTGRETVIPDPRVFRHAFVPSELTHGTTETSLIYPDISHAAVHLALLECFRTLRVSASELDVELEQPPSYQNKETPGLPNGPIRLPESERWDLLIRLAITRFTAWWMNIDQVFHHATAYTHHGGDKSIVQLTKDYLPPLDVLLVWYAFMLDGDEYAIACRDQRLVKLQQLCFPWPAIRDVIDMRTMTFNLPRAAENLFTTLSSQSTDIMTYLSAPPAYLETPGLPFTIDLFSQVKNHEDFIDQAHQVLWIRSPALRGSLERASVDYLEFQLSGKADQTIFGSLHFGVDLIWRTHRLYPIQYRLFRRGIGAQTQRDSKSLSSPTLRTISGDSSRAGQSLSECLCWTCERIREDLPRFMYDTTKTPAYDTSLLSTLSSEQLRSIQDDLGFYHAVEEARSRRFPLPTRPLTPAEQAAGKLEAKKNRKLERCHG